MTLRLCQFAPAVNQGDAMSHQAIEMHRAAETLGMEAALFEFGVGNDRSVPAHLYTDYRSRPDDVIVLHYGGRRHYEDWVARLPGRVFIYYQNVTPPHFFERIGFPWIEALYRGRDTLAGLAHLGGLTASEYNRRDMLRAGFRDVTLLPLLLDFDALLAAPRTSEAQAIVAQYRQPGVANWLHVGRVAPNKRIEDIVRAFYVYHTAINCNSRLFLVGSDKDMEAYTHPLRRWIETLGITSVVCFTGRVSDAELGGYYALADLYVCLSAHEGFCIPLVEAMLHRVPVIALRGTAITDTMGPAGVLVDTPEPRLVAQIAHLLYDNPAYREAILAGQAAQAQVWRPERAVAAFSAWLQSL